MRNLQSLTDKTAIGLSLFCAIHCLAFPLVLVLLPNIAALQFDNEVFHLWMVAAVIPTSAYALTQGCKKHKKYQLLTIGLSGLALLILAITFAAPVLGEEWEKAFTVLGAALISYGHYRNYRLCQRKEACPCPNSDNELST